MKQNTFELTIALGNTAMQTPEHVARTLEGLAAFLRQHAGSILDEGVCFRIQDDHGNQVGEWSYSFGGPSPEDVVRNEAFRRATLEDNGVDDCGIAE